MNGIGRIEVSLKVIHDRLSFLTIPFLLLFVRFVSLLMFENLCP